MNASIQWRILLLKYKPWCYIAFLSIFHIIYNNMKCLLLKPRRVGLVVSVSASHAVGRGFASLLGYTKDHHKNGTNCLPAKAHTR